LAQGTELRDKQIVQTTRIGITKAVDYPWRFYIRDNAWVSVKASKDSSATQTPKKLTKQKQAD
jgi:3-methyladenine DNA glycosylase Mpg